MSRFAHRFFLILLSLQVFLYGNGIARQQTDTTGLLNDYTGTYHLIVTSPLDNGYIEIKALTHDRMKFFIWVNRRGSIAETYGTFNVEENKGVFNNKRYNASNCLLAFLFKNDTIKLEQKGRTGECSFGYLANVSGSYKKTSSTEPGFSKLEWQKHANKKDSVYKKRRRVLDEREKMVAELIENHPVIIHNNVAVSREKMTGKYSSIVDDTLYNSFLKNTFRNEQYKKSVPYYLSTLLKPDTLTSYNKILSVNKDYQSFSKQWVTVTKTNNGYIITTNKTEKGSIEILNNSTIISSFYGLAAIPIKEFKKENENTYVIIPAYLKDSIDVCKFEIINHETGMAKVSVKIISKHFKVKYLNWIMVPVKSLTNFTFQNKGFSGQ